MIHPAVIIMIRMQYSPCLVSLGCSGWRTQSSPSRRGRSRTWDVFLAGHSSRRCERCGPLVCEHPKKSAAQAGARTPECHVWKSSDLVGTLSLDSCPTHTSLRYVTLVACSSFMIIVFRMTIASLRWTTLDFRSKKNDSIFLFWYMCKYKYQRPKKWLFNLRSSPDNNKNERVYKICSGNSHTAKDLDWRTFQSRNILLFTSVFITFWEHFNQLYCFKLYIIAFTFKTR